MQNSLNLWSLGENKEAHISSFCPTFQDQYRTRFIELGFREGECIRCMKITPFGGPRVYETGNTVFSISHEEASRIFLAQT